jgi:hypothetical protein
MRVVGHNEQRVDVSSAGTGECLTELPQPGLRPLGHHSSAKSSIHPRPFQFKSGAPLGASAASPWLQGPLQGLPVASYSCWGPWDSARDQALERRE